MTGPASTPRRLARAVVFAAVVTTAAVVAHVVAGGMTPGGRVVALTALAATAAGWVLGARRRGAAVLVTAAVAGQLGAHVTFSLAMRHAAHTGALSMVMCGRGAVDPHLAVTGMPAAPTGAGLWSAGWMTAAHVVAGAVVLLVARHGEDLAARVAAHLRPRAVLRRPAAVRTPSRPRPVAPPVRPLAGRLVVGGRGLRGPPLACS